MTTESAARRGPEPPDLSEKGGVKNGQPQRSDDRLFMQFQAFGGCLDTQTLADVAEHRVYAVYNGVDLDGQMGARDDEAFPATRLQIRHALGDPFRLDVEALNVGREILGRLRINLRREPGRQGVATLLLP